MKRRSRRIACEKTISPHPATYGGEREGDEAQKPSKGAHQKFQLNIIFQLMALFNNLGKEEEEPVVEYNFFLQMNQVSLFQRGRSDSKVECITFFRCNVHS